MPTAPTSPPRRRLLPRIRLGVAMLLIGAVAAGLGVVVGPARRQAETARQVEALGGKVRYDWEHREARPALKPGPRWLTDRLGPDYNHDITGIDLTTSDRADDALAARIAGLGELDTLRVGPAPRFTDAGLAHLAGLRNLSILGIYETGATGAGFEHLRGLHRLRLFYATGLPTRDADLQHLSGLGELDTVKLQGDALTDAGLAHLAPLGKLKNLTVIAPGRMKITTRGLAHLAKAAELRELHLFSTEIDTLEPLRSHQALRTIMLGDCPLDDRGIEPVAQIAGLGRLGLTGPGQRFTDAGLACVAGLKSLNSLWLNDTAIGDAALEHLADLPALAVLGLDGTRVTDAGLARLATFNLPLRVLSVGRTAVTDAGVAAVRARIPRIQVSR